MNPSIVGDTMKDVRTSVTIEMRTHVSHSTKMVEPNFSVTMWAIRLFCWPVCSGFQRFGPTVEFKRDNGRDDPVAASKLNIETNEKCDLGPSHCYPAV